MEIEKQSIPVLETGVLMTTGGAINSKGPKITVGFTTTPEHKLELSKEADALNITLSALIQLKLLNFKGLKANAINGATQSENEKALIAKLAALQQVLDLFQNDKQLTLLFNELKGETHEVKDSTGKKFLINVQTPYDAYIYLIYSFELVKPKS